MEEEIDIYADLPNFDLGENDNLGEINKKLTEKCTKLEKRVDDLTQSLESMRKINRNLEVNISSLLKTAKAEIARKDRMIATITSELDNIQFRRGKYGRSSKSTRHSPPLKVTEIPRLEEETRLQIPELTETMESIAHDVQPSVEKRIANEGHRLDGIVNTVFGERLRKRILDAQEEERRRKERETKLKDEQGLRKSEEKQNVESNSGDIEFEDKVSGEIRTRDKATSNSFPSECRRERKRFSEDPTDPNDTKKLKFNESKSNGGRRRDEKPRNGSEKWKSVKPDEDEYREEVADEYRTPVNDETRVKGKNVNVTGENESEERHGRVAMRLMLLSEGIDPGMKNEGIKIVEEKRRERNKNDKRSRGRSKSRNRDSKMKRRDHRSQSITPDEYYKSGRGGKQRDNRRRASRDRFDRRRDLKNKDGDNMSEFSREIFDLKERFEHRISDRSNDLTRRSESYNRHKRKDEKFMNRNGRSRTPDSSVNGSKERFKDDKRSRKNKGREVLSAKESKEETKSLVSLEDGEIVDSATSSPQKIVASRESLTAKDINSTNKSDSLDPVKLESKDNRDGSRDNEIPVAEKLATNIPESNQSVVANDSSNSSKDERIENIAEFIASFSTDQTNSELLPDNKKLDNFQENDNIREEKEKKEEVVDSRIECDSITKEKKCSEEKLEIRPISELQTSVNDSVVLLSQVKNSETITRANNVNDKDGNEDWHLIAIDSPVKNFEENRNNRIMAINSKVIENSEPPNISSEVKIASKLPLLPNENNPPPTRPIVVRALRSIYRKGKKKMILSDTNSEHFAKISSTTNTLVKSDPKVSIESETLNGIKELDDNYSESKNIEKLEEISASNVSVDIEKKNFNISVEDFKKGDKSDDVSCNYDDIKNIDNGKERTIEYDEENSLVRNNIELTIVNSMSKNNPEIKTDCEIIESNIT